MFTDITLISSVIARVLKTEQKKMTKKKRISIQEKMHVLQTKKTIRLDIA